MSPRFLVSLILTALALPLCGCESLSSPKLSVASASPTERTSEGSAMLFVIDARNDNDVALPLRTVEYSVDLNGQRVFSGTRSAEATLRRRGMQQFHLPAVVNLSEAGNAGLTEGTARYRLSGQVYYVTPGQLAEVLFDAGVRTPSESFAFEGDIDFNATPQAVPGSSPKPPPFNPPVAPPAPRPTPRPSPTATPPATPPAAAPTPAAPPAGSAPAPQQ